MGNSKKRKYSRSRSTDRHRNRDTTDDKLQKMQSQLDNLTNQLTLVVQTLKSQTASRSSNVLQPGDITPSVSTQEVQILEDLKENDQNSANAVEYADQVEPEVSLLADVSPGVSSELLGILGDDPSASKEIAVTFHPELKVRWEKWTREGYPAEDKKKVLEKYPRRKELYVEAPKVNLEILPVMSDIAKKRDAHFADTQTSLGSALSALGAAISLIINGVDDEVDQEALTTYLCDAGKLMCDVFHKHSMARRSFITPSLRKSIKPVVDATIPDEFLYSSKFAELVKEAKTVEKACSTIKQPEKLAKTATTVIRPQGNSKYPPARYRQVGSYPRRQMVKWKPRSTHSNQTTSKTSTQSTSKSAKK